ncbi:MAG: hypothetical protein GX022_03975 [Clostridiaceae bacterium]|nr:hypothetical protein [Clostridiaceae bacterium]
MDNEPERVDLRKGPDLILRMLDISSVILWGFIIINLIMIMFAMPEKETFFDRLFSIKIRDYWDEELLRFPLALSVVQLVISVILLFLNSKRLKRRDDRLRVSVIISLFVSLIICVSLPLFLYL